MRRLVAALALAGLLASSAVVPSASAQGVGFGVIPGLGTPSPIQCQFVNNTTTTTTNLAQLSLAQTCPTAFFGAGLGGVGSGLGVLPGLGFGLPGLGGAGLGGIGSGLGVLPGLGFGLPGLGGCPQGITLQQGVQAGLITVTAVNGVINVTLAGQTRALTAGQTLANTTIAAVFPNVCNGLGGHGLGHGLGLSSFGLFPGAGLGGIGSGLGVQPGLGFGLPGLGALGTAGVGNLTGTTIGGRTCTPQGAFLVCQ
jgi:hypothetical protein